MSEFPERCTACGDESETRNYLSTDRIVLKQKEQAFVDQCMTAIHQCANDYQGTISITVTIKAESAIYEFEIGNE